MAFWDDWFDSGDDYSYSDTYGDGGPDANGNWDNNWGGQSDTTNYNSSSSDWGWLSDVGDWYQDNKSWVAPAAKSAYGAYRANQAGDQYREQQQPLQDYYNKMLPRFEAYYDPANVEAGIGEEFSRRSGMLSDVWNKRDQARNAGALSKGTLGASTYSRQLADSNTARDKYLMDSVLPQSEQAYYAQPTQMMAQMRGTTGMMSAQPTSQPMYQSSQVNPYQDALDRYLVSVL